VLQSLYVQKLHGNKRLRVLLSDIVDRANVRVVESRGRPCLALKSFERVAVVRRPVREEFQRNEAVKARVFGLVHHTHPAAAELLNNALVRNCAANQSRASGIAVDIKLRTTLNQRIGRLAGDNAPD
jgi:hypothetical protein